MMKLETTKQKVKTLILVLILVLGLGGAVAAFVSTPKLLRLNDSNSGWNPEKTRIRREVNDWIRTSGAFDGVIDFDAVVRDSADPDRIAAAFDCDGIHPNPRGYFEMGGAVPLELFSR